MPLDETLHIGAEENVKALILNITDLAVYAEHLEAVIKCYSPPPLPSSGSDNDTKKGGH